MNERIKELYGPAYKFAKENCVKNIDDLGNNYFKLFHEKFAELIVQECARVAKITEPDAGDEYASGRTWAGIDVLKHFGVEE